MLYVLIGLGVVIYVCYVVKKFKELKQKRAEESKKNTNVSPLATDLASDNKLKKVDDSDDTSKSE